LANVRGGGPVNLVLLGLMRQIVHIAAFWVVVIVSIRLAVCFPRSLLARVFFSRIGPVRVRDELEADYLLRWARFGMSCFAQSALLFVSGWATLQLEATLFDSLVFAVLWVVVIPLLGVGALLVAVVALARSLWVRRSNRSKLTFRSIHEPQA
jgi:hypothetical protein